MGSGKVHMGMGNFREKANQNLSLLFGAVGSLLGGGNLSE